MFLQAGPSVSRCERLLAVSQRSIDICDGHGESWIHWIMRCGAVGIYARQRKSESFSHCCFQVLLYGCETWTLINDLRWGLNSFGTRSLRRILGCRWSDFVSNEYLLRETQMRFVSCIVCEHHLWLYGHVANFPDADPVHQILSAREPRGWRPTGQPHASWLQAGYSAS